jgi:Abortive infection C-terminus
MAPIPPSVIGTAAPILADWYTHAQLNALFDSHGFPGDAPDGNKIEKCRLWLRHGNKALPDALTNFGNLIAEMMDAELVPPYRPPWDTSEVKEVADPRDRLIAALAKEGLSYGRGGYIHGASLTGPSKSLGDRLKANSIQAVETEFDRAYKSIESDPPAAVTAACAILEAVCKHYLETKGLELPNKQLLGNLWPLVMQHLGLSPKDIADDDLKQILTGLYSISTGIAALRTHEGSAHGRGSKKTYRMEARHARLSVHAAHTMTMFVLETWEARKKGA